MPSNLQLKFGYRSNLKPEKLKNPLIFLQLVGTCCTHLAKFSPFLGKSSELGKFFSQKSFAYVQNHIFHFKKMRKFTPPKQISN
jgi:hypothetical protein